MRAGGRTARPGWSASTEPLLIAGATGAGKGSLIWSLIRAMLPAMRDGLVRVLAADPKPMELAPV